MNAEHIDTDATGKAKPVATRDTQWPQDDVVVPQTSLTPTATNERFVLMDVVRGFAVLGILVMNITAFALPMAAYQNPNAMGVLAGAEYMAWWITEVFANCKFISLFSLLFGAGIALMAERISARGGRPFILHLRRMAGLLLIGLIHAYGFWYGDILVTYAICGVLCFVARDWSPPWLIAIGMAVLSVTWILVVLFSLTVPFWPPGSIQQVADQWAPPADHLQAEIDAYRGSWLDQSAYRVPMSLKMQLVVLPVATLWRVCGLILIGMALFKSRFILGGWRPPVYPLVAVGGIAFGLAGTLLGISLREANDSATFAMFLGLLPNDIASIPMAIGYAALLQCLLLGPLGGVVAGILAPVGRMAMTNYLGQTLICTTLFYGHGLGGFGRLDRIELWVVVLAIWVFQIAFSIAWLTHFKQGPVEAFWRRMTYSGAKGKKM
ncbi:MAG: DUF418 domain-containing protein [Planctomycetota bacterium]